MLRSNIGYQLSPGTIDQLLSDNLFWLAESYSDIGDLDSALNYLRKCKSLQDKCDHGEMTSTGMQIQSRFAYLVLKKCRFEMGTLEEIVVPNIKKAYVTMLTTFDKVFKFVRSNKDIPYVYPPNTPYLISKCLVYSQVSTLPSKNTILTQLTKIILQLKIAVLGNEKEIFKKAREHEINPQLYKTVILQIIQLGPAQYFDDLLTRYKCGEKVLPNIHACIALVEEGPEGME